MEKVSADKRTDKKLFSGWFGDRNFYSKVMAILIPMVIQQGITNFVNLLDNVMVGQLGTIATSGVAIVNQFIFVFNLMVFGLLAGASIFGAQFYGKGDNEGFHQTVRFRIAAGLLLAIAGWIAFSVFGRQMVILYLGNAEETETIACAGTYLFMICFQLAAFVLVQAVGGALKDCGETRLPMEASVLAIFTNLVLNYLLIYGKFGFPRMEVAGAALATVIARYLELLFLVLSAYRKRAEFPYMNGIFSSLTISGDILKKMIITGTPLFLNETLWSLGVTMINSCYATRGVDKVVAININQTVWNLFGVVCLAMGNAIGIIAGQHLGANDFEGAKDSVRKMMVLSVLLNIGIGILIILISPFVPLLYKTEEDVRHLATRLLWVSGIMMPVSAYFNACYFALRSGGKTVITFFFDCGFTWAVSFTAAWLLSRFTGFDVLKMFIIVQSLEVIKVIIGTILIRSGIWINNVVAEQ